MAFKVSTVNFLIANTSSVVINAGMTTQMAIRGLTGMPIPKGYEGSTITVTEMGRAIDLLARSSISYSAVDIPANFLPGDPSQTFLETAGKNDTPITTMRFYLKENCDFAALDLVNDPGGSYSVGSFSAPTANKGELYTNSIQILPGGSSVLFIAHTTIGGGTNITFAAEDTTGATATLSTGTWADFGFEAGDVVIADYVNSLDPFYLEVDTIVDAVMTFSKDTGGSASVPTGAGVAATRLHGATPIEVSDADTTC